MEGSYSVNLIEREGLAIIREVITEIHEVYVSNNISEVPKSKLSFFRKKIRSQKLRINTIAFLKISNFNIKPEGFKLAFQMILSEVSFNKGAIFGIKAVAELIKPENEISAFYMIFHCLIVLVKERLGTYERASEYIQNEFEAKLCLSRSFYFNSLPRKPEKASNFKVLIIFEDRVSRQIDETIKNALRLASDILENRASRNRGEFQDKCEKNEECFDSLLPIKACEEDCFFDENELDIECLDLD